MNDQFKHAVDAALKGEWNKAHVIVQEYSDVTACWIHAVLHKIEGDVGNSRYWYARAQRSYDEYADPDAELKAISAYIEAAKPH